LVYAKRISSFEDKNYTWCCGGIALRSARAAIFGTSAGDKSQKREGQITPAIIGSMKCGRISTIARLGYRETILKDNMSLEVIEYASRLSGCTSELRVFPARRVFLCAEGDVTILHDSLWTRSLQCCQCHRYLLESRSSPHH
jgi:hypothetical protein